MATYTVLSGEINSSQSFAVFIAALAGMHFIFNKHIHLLARLIGGIFLLPLAIFVASRLIK